MLVRQRRDERSEVCTLDTAVPKLSPGWRDEKRRRDIQSSSWFYILAFLQSGGCWCYHSLPFAFPSLLFLYHTMLLLPPVGFRSLWCLLMLRSDGLLLDTLFYLPRSGVTVMDTYLPSFLLLLCVP